MWRRIMSWLWQGPASRHDPRVEAAIARNLEAQERVAVQAEQAEQASAENRADVHQAVEGMKARTAARLARKSWSRDIAEAALQQMAERRAKEGEGNA
jgi:hypothetical protein